MNRFQKVLLIPGSLVLVASLGMACADDDDAIATPTSPIMTDGTPTPTPTMAGGTNGDNFDDVVTRVNDLGAEIAMATEEERAEVQDLWNRAQTKLSELATATEAEREEIRDELEELADEIEERLS